MKLLLTGGTGFFGKSLLRYFLSASHACNSEIFVLSRNPDLFLEAYPEFCGHEAITFLKGDIQESFSLPWRHVFTHVVHAAAEAAITNTRA